MIKIGFYPGCSLNGISSDYAQSIFALVNMFNVNLVEIEDWNCCGASAAHNINDKLAFFLPTRILVLAEKQGFKEILVPCAACYNRLNIAQNQFRTNEFLKNQGFELFQKFNNNIRLLNIIQFIELYLVDELVKRIVNPFNYSIVCYYGCLLIRPHNILKFDRLEDPQSMDNLMRKIGANPLNWPYKTECCGAGLSVSRAGIVAKLCGNIIKEATSRGAEAIIVSCPMCQSNLDMRCSYANNYLHTKTKIPVIYITQAIGLSIGMKERDLNLKKCL